MSRKILGLDIRHDSLTAVLISGTIQGQVIEALEYIDLNQIETMPVVDPVSATSDEQAEEDNPVPGGDERGEALLKMLELLSRKIDFTNTSCCVAFPAGDVSYRNLVVPALSHKKIRQILPFELENVIPGSVEELTVDFLEVDQLNDGQECRIVAAAVNRTLLESFSSCLKRGGINPDTIVPGGSSSAEYLIRTCDTASDYMFLDYGRKNSTLFLIHNGKLATVRAFRSGQDKGLTAAININRTALVYAEMNELAYQPEVVFVTGSGLSESGVRETLIQTTGLQIESVDFFENMGFILDDRIRDLWDPDLFTNAMSLCYGGLYGFKGLKLTERFVAFGKYFSEYREKIIRRAVLLGLIVFVFLFNSFFDTVAASRKIRQYDDQMKAIYKEIFPGVSKIVDPYNELKAKMAAERKKSSFADSTAGNVRVIDLLNDISTSVQDSMNVEFSSFVLSPEDLKITGTSDSYSTVDSVKGQLEKIAYVKSVMINSTTSEQNDKLIHFKLAIIFKGQQ